MLNLSKLTPPSPSSTQGHVATRERLASLTGRAQHRASEVAAVLDLRQGLPGAERSDTRGGVAVMTALLAVGLVGVSALAVDVGVWQVNKGGLQGAADQAVLAASLAASSGNIVMTNEAKGIAAAHGFVNGTDDVTVTLNKPPATGAYAGVATAIEVVITQQQKSFLSGVVNNFSAPVASAKAVVALDRSNTCVVALATSGTGISGGQSSSINAEGCDVHVNSTSNCSVNLTNKQTELKASKIFLRAPSTCGSNVGNTSASKTKTNAPQVEDPYRNRITPTPDLICKPNPTSKKKEEISVSPGTYCNFEFNNQDINLTPGGIYIVNGGRFSISGSSAVRGNGVTIFVTGPLGAVPNAFSIQSNSSSLTLTPPETGSTRGIALWIDGRTPTTAEFGSGANVNITGAIYAPNAGVTWGNSTSSSECLQLVSRTVEMSNSSSFRHNCANVKGIEDVTSTTYTLRE